MYDKPSPVGSQDHPSFSSSDSYRLGWEENRAAISLTHILSAEESGDPFICGASPDLVGSSDLRDTTGAHDGDTVSDREGFTHIVRHVNDRQPKAFR
jgi:hypothetical protein